MVRLVPLGAACVVTVSWPRCAGIRLLQAMGWRQGKGVGAGEGGRGGAKEAAGGGRWGRVAGVGLENVPLYRLEPKDNVHGLGFDPFRVRVQC